MIQRIFGNKSESEIENNNNKEILQNTNAKQMEINNLEIQQKSEQILNKLYPYGTEITMGSVFGFCAGYFSKKMAQRIIYNVGGGFVALQLLQHQGFIEINYHKLYEAAIKRVKEDYEGQVTTNDAKYAISKYLAIIGAKIPSSTGFVTAFYVGFRMK